MKLMRVGEPGKEKPALLDKDGKVRDLSAHIADISGEAIGRTVWQADDIDGITRFQGTATPGSIVDSCISRRIFPAFNIPVK